LLLTIAIETIVHDGNRNDNFLQAKCRGPATKALAGCGKI